MKAFVITILIYLALVLGVRLAHCQSQVSDFDARLLKFNATWNTFFRAHFNCPKGSLHFEECKPDENNISYDGFPKVVHSFTKLFVGGPDAPQER